MSVLVVAEHDNSELKPATRVAVAAAEKMGGDIHVLVAGAGCAAVAEAAAKVAGVGKVLQGFEVGNRGAAQQHQHRARLHQAEFGAVK